MKVLVSAESFGYGPISTCLDVVKELKKFDDVSLDFIGSGISLEQAKLSKYFDKFYECDTYDKEDLKKFADVYKEYDIYFNSENIQGAIFGLNYIKNVYYVDNLVWMWDEIPAELGKVKKYFISETFSCKENFKRIGNVIENPVFVGPVRNLKINTNKKIKNQILINIGGASSFLFDQSIINKFYNKIINDILESSSINKFDSIIICGGSEVLSNIVLRRPNNKVLIKTLSHDEYLNAMNESKCLILSSGLGNFIETLNSKKNIMYLPPINYSQLLQLNYYDLMSYGFEIMNWNLFEFYKEIPMYLDEETGVKMVMENVNEYIKNDYKDMINNRIDKFINSNQKDFFNIRKKSFEKFDKNAAKIIAETIYNENK